MMTSKQFIKLLQEPETINENSVVEIEGLIKQSPYFQTAHLMYLLALNKINPKIVKEKLPVETLYISDRYTLYKRLQQKDSQPQDKPAKEEKNKKVAKPVSDKAPSSLEDLKKHHDEIANDMFGLNEVKEYNMVVTNVEADGTVKSPLSEPDTKSTERSERPDRERPRPRREPLASATQPEVKVEGKAEPKPEVKVEAKVESKPEVKVEAKAEPKPEVKVEAKVEPKPEPKIETKVVTTTVTTETVTTETVKTEEKKPAGKSDILAKIAQLKKESEEATKKRTATVNLEEKAAAEKAAAEKAAAEKAAAEKAAAEKAAAAAAATVAAVTVTEKTAPVVETKVEVTNNPDGGKTVTEKTTVTTTEKTTVATTEAPATEETKTMSAAERLKMRLNKYKNKTEEEKKEEQVSKNDLIDKFLKESPHIDRNKEVPTADLGQESNTPPEGIYSEKLATLYTEQKLYDKAIAIYNELILKNPEKSDIFAARITEINNLKQNNK